MLLLPFTNFIFVPRQGFGQPGFGQQAGQDGQGGQGGQPFGQGGQQGGNAKGQFPGESQGWAVAF